MTRIIPAPESLKPNMQTLGSISASGRINPCFYLTEPIVVDPARVSPAIRELERSLERPSSNPAVTAIVALNFL